MNQVVSQLMLVVLTLILCAGCGRERSLSKSAAEKLLRQNVQPLKRSERMMLTNTKEASAVIDALEAKGLLKKVEPLWRYSGPDQGRLVLASWNPYFGEWEVDIPFAIYSFGGVTEILTDDAEGMAEVSYRLVGTVNEMNCAGFRTVPQKRGWNVLLPQNVPPLSRKAFFKRYEEGWRLIQQ